MEVQENITRVDEQTGPEPILFDPGYQRIANVPVMSFPIREPVVTRGCDFSGGYYDGRRIFRVPYQLRNKNKEDYAPQMVSFGPYNHGSDELRLAEELKPKVVEMLISESGKDRGFFYDRIFQVIDQVRLCYDGITRDIYNDEKLAEMVVRDTFFLIYLMQKSMNETKHKYLVQDNLGISAIPSLYTDTLLLDNQIPLSIINFFASTISNEEEGSPSFVLRYFENALRMVDHHITQFPTGKDGKQPLHPLDACWRVMIEAYGNKQEHVEVEVHTQDEEHNYADVFRHISRSITDLKTKGIYFKSNGSQCVKDIQFRSWLFFGELQLPVLVLDAGGKAIYSNLIAFEMSPGSTSNLVVTSYINFMKSLALSPKDVNELREKEILFCTQDNDEHVMKLIKGINTYGLDNPNIFSRVKTAGYRATL